MNVQLVAADVYTMSAGRIGSIVAGVLGLAGVIIGGLTLARRFRNGRRGGVISLATGLICMALGALVVATSDGGIGTGNGRGGAYVALVVGLIAVVLGGLALTRARRLTRS